MSDSFDKNKTAAYDQFLGESYTTVGNWHEEGEILESFSPEELTLFELVLIAYVVHKLYPYYSKLGTNCYFFASLVYAVAKRYGGVRPGLTTLNHLAQHGHWNGMKITRIKQYQVDRVLAQFKHLKSMYTTCRGKFKFLQITLTY